jgi:hypothetical protein
MRILILIPILLTSTAAFAVDCKSVEGRMGKRTVEAEREAVMQGSALQLSGTIDGERMPHQTIDCIPFGTGILCERRTSAAIVTVTTEGRQMTETIKNLNTGQELAAITYECGRAFTLKR